MNANVSSFLSATSNFSSIAFKSMLGLPARLFSHMRRVDDAFIMDIQPPQGEGQAPPSYSNIPGPWAFITSSYAFSLVIMGLLLNRIHHMVVPPRHSFVRRLSRQHNHLGQRRSVFRTLISFVFPINLNATLTRTIIRTPSMYLLWRSLVLFIIILLQISGLLPSASVFSSVSKWAYQTDTKDVCWGAFVAVCVTLTVEALMKGLEGRNTPSAFNLLGYAFLLHIYSSPITHNVKSSAGGPSRPDKHVLITIIIPLFQLTMIHTLGIRHQWANQRLVPTTICGLLTLFHFHYVYFFSSTPYPLINYLPSLLESLLLIIILFTVSLYLLTQMLLEGYISQPLLGHYRSLAPRWDEDFASALLRIGTASLDATNVAGLGNEVAGVGVDCTEGPEIELSRHNCRQVRGGRGGFTSEIKHIKIHGASKKGNMMTSIWLRINVLRRAWCLLRLTLHLIYKAAQRRFLVDPNSITQAQIVDLHKDYLPEQTRPPEDIYRRFLRGDNLSDDDDDEEYIDEKPINYGNSPPPNSSGSDVEDETEWEDNEAVELYAEISRTRNNSPSLAPVLLAHVAHNDSPLTRRQYNRLSIRPEDGWVEIIQERRKVKVIPSSVANDEAEVRRNCVICTVEPREIICWPCRCLALCDDCRGNLGSRLPPYKHTCPCCRRSVDGYSRIYIP